MKVKIIEFSSDFTEDVVDLWKACSLVVPWNNPYEDIKMKLAFQPHLFYIALINEKLIGTVMAGYEGHRGWINYLAVDPQVRESNKGVIAFYEAIGYKNDHVISLGKRIASEKT